MHLGSARWTVGQDSGMLLVELAGGFETVPNWAKVLVVVAGCGSMLSTLMPRIPWAQRLPAATNCSTAVLPVLGQKT